MLASKSIKGAISNSEPLLLVFRFGVCFILLSTLLFLLGFATNHWHKDPMRNYGLWESCQGGVCTDLGVITEPAYHIATRILQILSVLLYILAPIIHFFMYCMRTTSKDLRTRILDIGFCIGTMFHFISVTVFGLVHPSPEFLSWSYNLSGAGLGLAAVGIVLIIVSRRTAAKAFLSSKHRSSWMRAVPSNSVNPSRTGTPQSGTSRRSAKDFRSQPQHTMPQSSAKVPSSSHHPGTSFCTTSSDKPYPDSFKMTPWGSKVESHNLDSPALESYVSPSVTTPAELPPVRAPYTKTQQNVKVSVGK